VRRSTLIEAVLVTAGSFVVTGWAWSPAVKGLRTSVPVNLGDPLYFAWQLAWVSHAAASDAPLWTTNAFHGTPGNLAFTDAILGYAPLGLVARALGTVGQAAALVQLNLAGLLATVLAVVGAYALARAMGAGRAGSLVAGAGFGYAPWRLEQVIHVNVVSTGGMALALALLARGHGWSMRKGHDPERASRGWVLAGWAVACWQISVSLAIGVPFAYALVVVSLVSAAGWLRAGRPPLGVGAQARKVLVADGVGGLALLAVTVLIVRPYLTVIATYPEAKRTAAYLPLFSPPFRGLFTSPSTDRWWGVRQASLREGLAWTPEMVLLPGFILIGLALAGVFYSAWRRTWRISLAVVTVATALLSLGTTVAGGQYTYLPLFNHLPGWNGLRTPGRLIIWVTLALCLLAAGFVDAVVRAARARIRIGPERRDLNVGPALLVGVCAVLLPVLIVLEGRGNVPYWQVAEQPIALARLRQPVLVLPTDQIADYHIMVWSTQGWPRLVNGGTGFEPNFQAAMRKEAQAFPSLDAADALRRRGVATVVVVPSRARGTPWEQATQAATPAGVKRTDYPDAVVYDLRSPVTG